MTVRVVCTAGHVDHGKSTLLRALTGMEPDRWAEERDRGLTIDLGFVWTDLPTQEGRVTVAFVDVPGHERFIANMLAGAGAVPLALFVVAADDGWSAQSTEHLEILDLLGVSVVLTAVTKVGLVPDDRVDQVFQEIRERSGGTVLDEAPTVAVDGVSGHGLDELRAVLAQRLVAAPTPQQRDRPRLWVDRSFTVRGTGTVVTGTLAGGELAVGDPALLAPHGTEVRVRGLQTLGREVRRVTPGSRVAVNLGGVDADDVRRGDAVLGLSGRPGREIAGAWHVTGSFDAHVRPLPGRVLGRRGAWHLHVGSAETRVEIRPLLRGDLDGPGIARLRIETSLPLVSGDRFVIRDAGRRRTAAGGQVLDPAPRPVRGDADRISRSDELAAVAAADDPPDRLRALVAADGGARDSAAALAASGADPAADLPDGIRRAGQHLVDVRSYARWREGLLDAAQEHERAAPQTTGLRRDELKAAAVAAGCPSGAGDDVVDQLVADGELSRSGSRYVTAEHAESRDEAIRTRAAHLIRALEDDLFSPPDLREAAAEAGLSHEEVNFLVERGEIVVSGRVAFSARAVEEAIRRLAALEEAGGPFTTAEAREALGTSRKYAIPLLEHLDGRGLTAFDGRTRTVRRGSGDEP